MSDPFEIINDDCINAMQQMEPESVESIVTDPPYGLAFMGKSWDHAVPGVEYWAECLRVLKPGGHLMAFGGTRLYHRLTCAIEDAGFEIRDCLMWVYGSGFPKSHDVSKAIDKAAGAAREKIEATGSLHKNMNDDGWNKIGAENPMMDSNIPATPEALQWQGWGTALKPAWEPIIMARKPFKGTVANNVSEHGTGALNIDGCRVTLDGIEVHKTEGQIGGSFLKAGITSFEQLEQMYNNGIVKAPNGENIKLVYERCLKYRKLRKEKSSEIPRYNAKGRWPANFVHDGSDEVLELFPKNEGRYFYAPKASQAERNAGLTDLPTQQVMGGGGTNNPEAGRIYGSIRTKGKNSHATVKPLALMRWLCRMVTPPGGTVLDPFAGSGSTAVAAMQEGFNAIGIEREEEYAMIARLRCEHEMSW